MQIITRDVPPRATWTLEQAGVHPLLARLFAARGVHSSEDLDDGLAKLLPPDQLLGITEAAQMLVTAIQAQAPICIVADYDCDGATACAVAVRGLRLLGSNHAHYLVPDRVTDGYGLTPGIAKRVAATGARLLVTVDNGIASFDGVQTAKELGMQVLITDHHLPALLDGRVQVPQADAVVNPNQPGCPFESKSIAGVGVMFYVLLKTRALMRSAGIFDAATQPKLDTLLPLVALGTVADVVKLDANNRRLVAQGLKRIRAGHLPAGMAALFQIAGRQTATASTGDFGFAVGPRLNAAGRLADMTLGIACLITDDAAHATTLAQSLDQINRDRKSIEGDMREQALAMAEDMLDAADEAPPAICIFDPDFHEGVVGIVASRLKDKMHRPTFVFAMSQAAGAEDELKGSGRSIAGFHLRDALDLIAKRHPSVLLRFGGHAMAAGCTIDADQLDTFETAFQQVASEWLDEKTLTRQLETDGALAPAYRHPDIVDHLQQAVWGQGFAPPVFSEWLDVVSQRIVGEKHLALKLKHQGQAVDGIWFGHTEPLPAKALLAFRVDADSWQGQRRVRFLIEGQQA
ncbi:MAG: single-stranded-DNA-specific exonuclease RecJ [Burkholderiaceae bacterium]